MWITGEAAAVEIETAEIDAAPGETDGDAKPKLPTFRTRAYGGGLMRPNVAGVSTGSTPIVIDLAGARIARNGRGTPILFAHDKKDPIGHTDRVDVTTSIDASGVLSVPGKSRDKVAGGAEGGFRWAVSVGFQATELEYLAQKERATVNGRLITGPAYIARRGTLREISFLPIGADESASATVSATLAPLDPLIMTPELRAYITAAGFNADEISDDQVEFFRSQHNASIEAEAAEDEPVPKPKPKSAPVTEVEAGAGDHVDPIAELRAQYAAETQRVNRITAICAEHKNPTIKLQGVDRPVAEVAIEAGWDVTQTELEALRASRPTAPAAHSTGRSQTFTIDAVNAGLMMRCGVDIEATAFRGMAAIEAGTPDWLNADVNAERFQRTAEAGRRFRHSHIMEILASVAELETGTRPHGKTAILEAAFSTNAIASLFGTTVGARTLMAFREVNDTTQGWTRNGTVPDFEEHGRHQLESMESFDHLPAGGEAGQASRAAWKEIVSAARYAKQWQIDEQDLIGDRLGLLTRSAQQAGAAAGRLRPDLVYGVMLANPTMARTNRAAFHLTDGTLLTAAALSGPAMSTAIASMMKQKDGDATLNLQPTHLITGAELSDTAVQLLGSATLSNDSGKGANNPIARYGITPVADARISNGVVNPTTKVLQAGSATAWFLVSTDGETIEIVTVEGTGATPVTMVTNLRGVGKFGVQIESKYDIGAKIVENRTMRKNAGA
ncbi:phage major capsid protein [Allorhodopirellula heiligendammensis]|uniref:phage major capsid protein n=1 Tax=Allorhodopirellula heiligendammensis TaxID=2714739 RepID=UPI0011B8507F|nr:hypothetical protein [Allorhodopirellula heiligendammensis]